MILSTLSLKTKLTLFVSCASSTFSGVHPDFFHALVMVWRKHVTARSKLSDITTTARRRSVTGNSHMKPLNDDVARVILCDTFGKSD